MRRLCCEKFSDFCEVRLLDEKDVELIYGLGVTNPSFYASNGFVPDKNRSKGDLRLLPRGKASDDKYFAGFFLPGRMIAAVDLIDGYPDRRTAFIGFFMVNGSLRGKGTGTKIIDGLMNCLKNQGFHFAQLAYESDNRAAEAFWRKNGFETQRTVETEQGRLIVARRSFKDMQ